MVVDASVAIKAIQAPAADAVRSVMTSASVLAAPELIDLEVASVLRRRVELERKMTAAVATRILSRMRALPIRRYGHGLLMQRVWSLRHNLTPYDACYVALAEHLAVPLATGDARLAQAPDLRCQVLLLT